MNNKNGIVAASSVLLMAFSLHTQAQTAAENDLPEQCFELGVAEHTMVIQAVQDNADILAEYASDVDVDTEDRSFDNMSYALSVLLEIGDFSEELARAMETTAVCLNALDISQVDEETYQQFQVVAGDIDGAQEFDELFTILDGFQERYVSHSAEEDGLADAMTVAQRILEDGQASIYDPGLEVYSATQVSAEGETGSNTETGGSALDMAKADSKGAIVGGITGCASTGPGCLGGVLPGAAVGAIGHSVFEFLNRFW
ncbi:MAG: hypothetical protein ACQEUG_16050 [Pseudomonadota bacterium]